MAKKPASRPPDATMPVVCLHGPELFVRSELVAALRAELSEVKGEVESFRFDGDRDAAADVLDECRSFGLMMTHKLVIVDSADPLVKADSRGPLERYLASPAESATLVLLCKQWYKSKLDDAIAGVGGTVFKCEAPSEGQALAWSARRAKSKHGVEIARDAAEMLIARLGADLGRIDSELAKLAVVAHDRGSGAIDRAAVVEMVGTTREEEVWSVQAPLLTGNPERVISHLSLILDRGSRDASVPVMYACVDLARKLHLASHALAQGMPEQAVGKNIGLWGPSQRPVLEAARRLSPARASDLFDAAINADRASKSGLGRARRLVERLALRLTLAVAGHA
ncbi:MAG: DNA polymerase III subunit delta [Planctomycetota bacterium]